MSQENENKTWVWVLVVLGIIIIWWGYNSWYKTRISPYTPQSGYYDCPSDKLIKGNAQSGIYHVPGGQYYDQTMPERCFSTESDAVNAGYRRSSK